MTGEQDVDPGHDVPEHEPDRGQPQRAVAGQASRLRRLPGRPVDAFTLQRVGRTMSAVDGLKAEIQRLLDVNAQLHAELDGLRRELAGTREELEDALAQDRAALELEALLAEAERALGLDQAAPIDRWMARGFGVYR